jgi:hypothetical protein
MRIRPILTLSCAVLAMGAANLFGQTALPSPSPAPVPPAVTSDCPPVSTGCCQPVGPVCPPKPCSICGAKSFCEHLKCSVPNKCAQPAVCPKITVVMPQPEVVVRPAGHPSSCCAKGAPVGASPRVPVGATGAAGPILVPQLSYTMQPVVQQVVTMQAVPTVTYGVAVGVSQGVGIAPGVGVGAVGIGAVGAQGVGLGGASELDVLLLRALLSAKANGGAGTGTGAGGAGGGGIGAAAPLPTIAELDAHIKALEADLAKTGQLVIGHEARIKDVEGKVNNLIDAVKTTNKFEDFKAKVK